MKTKSFIALVVLVATFLGTGLTSCSNDDYSLDKFTILLATVVKNDDASFYLESDNGEKLWIAASSGHYYPKDGQRIMANVTFLSDKTGDFDHYIRLNSMSEVLTKPTIELTEANADSIGNDKIFVYDIWYSKNYLNVIFGINIGGEKTHFINLVENTTVAHPNDQNIYLELRHNDNGDSEKVGRKYIVSFDMTKFVETSLPQAFVIKYDTYREGQKTVTIKLLADETKVDVNQEEIYVNTTEVE